MITQNQRLTGILTAVAVLLLIPVIANFDWSGFDFLVAAVLLLGTGMACEFVLRKVKSTRKRLLIIGLILFALFLVWAELAVGVFGTPFAGS